METNRRLETSKLVIDLTGGILVVGGRTAVLDPEPRPDLIVNSYIDLVAAQRAVVPTSRGDLRDRELIELARQLDLPEDELGLLIDHGLDRLLGRDVAPAVRTEHRRLLIAAIGLAVLTAAAVGVTVVASGSDAVREPVIRVESPAPVAPAAAVTVPAPIGEPVGTPEVVTLPDGTTATRTESPAAVPTADTDVDTAVVFER